MRKDSLMTALRFGKVRRVLYGISESKGDVFSDSISDINRL